MKIKVVEEGRNRFSMGFPALLVINYFSASFAPLFLNAKLKKHGVKITGSMCRKFVRSFYKSKKHFGGSLDLINVEAKDGTVIKITV